MYSNKECLLVEILKCGTSDLDMLEETNYDMSDILEYLGGIDNKDFNDILYAIIKLGLNDLQDIINETTFDKNDLDIASELDTETDFDIFTNFQDTHIYTMCDNDKRKLYNKYFSNEIKAINDKIGFASIDIEVEE
jgi:hypothetical protein